MDKIIARGLSFKGTHGVLATEKTTPQPFLVDLIMYRDLSLAGRTDDLNQTVSYDDVFHVVRRIVEEESFALIERLAEVIADQILGRFALEAVAVTVYKPQAPVEGSFEYFAVEIYREKN